MTCFAARRARMFALALLFAVPFALPLAAPALPALAQQSQAQPREHRLVIHVDENDPAKMELALSNAANVSKFYNAKGEEVEIEIVAYGPGLNMLRADTSPVKERMHSFLQGMPNVTFTACGITMDTMKRHEGKDIPLLPGVKVFSTGVARIMELQEQGWSYVKP